MLSALAAQPLSVNPIRLHKGCLGILESAAGVTEGCLRLRPSKRCIDYGSPRIASSLLLGRFGAFHFQTWYSLNTGEFHRIRGSPTRTASKVPGNAFHTGRMLSG